MREEAGEMVKWEELEWWAGRGFDNQVRRKQFFLSRKGSV